LLFSAGVAAAQVPAASESDVFLPEKADILGWMAQASKLPAAEQDDKVSAALKNVADSSGDTPRSDFQLCLALAYMGNAKAQRCAGYAYENGVGVVDDQLEARAWFAVASDGGDADSAGDEARVTLRLNSAYPAPSEEELEHQKAALKEKVAAYQKDLKR
jgi:TPR repeat protein